MQHLQKRLAKKLLVGDNYVYEGNKLPEDYACPLCGHGADDFEPIYES